MYDLKFCYLSRYVLIIENPSSILNLENTAKPIKNFSNLEDFPENFE